MVCRPSRGQATGSRGVGWAHLLRKAIKRTRQEPDKAEYRSLTDGLLEIDQDVCRAQRNQRLSEVERQARVRVLDNKRFELIKDVWFAELPQSEVPANDDRLLVNELMRLLLARRIVGREHFRMLDSQNPDDQASNPDAATSMSISSISGQSYFLFSQGVMKWTSRRVSEAAWGIVAGAFR